MELKVGELAKRTGLTVRTLHHYDEIGLLKPSARTPAGHRLYRENDISRLQRIASLRQLGIGLPEVAECLAGDAVSIGEVLVRQIAHLRERIDAEERLVHQLEGIVDQLDSGVPVSSEQLLETIGMTTMFEKYYSAKGLSQLEQRAQKVGSERMEEVQQEWSALHAAMEDARVRGLRVDTPEVNALAMRAQSLVSEFTGGSEALQASLATMAQEERPAMHRMWGISEELGAYYQQAMAALESAR